MEEEEDGAFYKYYSFFIIFRIKNQGYKVGLWPIPVWKELYYSWVPAWVNFTLMIFFKKYACNIAVYL